MGDELLRVKFYGEILDSRSMPIYELGSAFISIQRIVYKAAQFADGKLEKGSSLPAKRREQLALQVSKHERGSDLWDFRPFLTDPALGPIFQGLIVTGLAALAAYTWRKIKSEPKQAPQNQVLIVNLFPEAKQISDRVGNIGGVDRIEISSPQIHNAPRISIDAGTQEYIRELEYELIPGKKTIISGIVTRLHPQSFRLDVEDAPGHYVHVTMDSVLFDRVRRLRELTEREIRFEGVPLYKLGVGGGVHEFRANRLIIPRKR